MARPILQVIKEAQAYLEQMEGNRIHSKLNVEFDDLRDSMFHMHCAWQDLNTTVRKDNGDLERATTSATKLAAVALKFAADLGARFGPAKREIIDKIID